VTIDDSPIINKQTSIVSDQPAQVSEAAQKPKTIEDSLQKAVNDIVTAVFKAIGTVIDGILSSIKKSLTGASLQESGSQTDPADAITDANATVDTSASTSTAATDTSATPTDSNPSTLVDGATVPAPTKKKKKKKHGLFNKVGKFFKKMIKGAKDLLTGANQGLSLMKDPKSWLRTKASSQIGQFGKRVNQVPRADNRPRHLLLHTKFNISIYCFTRVYPHESHTPNQLKQRHMCQDICQITGSDKTNNANLQNGGNQALPHLVRFPRENIN
jgi:hypothetical protein